MQSQEKTVNKNKTIIKYLILGAVFIAAIVISIITSGVVETLNKFLVLVICATIGFVLFYAAYYIAYYITQKTYLKKRKTQVEEVVSKNEDINRLISSKKYAFKYQNKLSFENNLQNLLKTLLVAIEDVACGFDKSGKYYYLNYTAFDGIDVIKNVINAADEKVGGVLKVFGVYNKPIGIIEKKLNEIIEKEQPKKKSAIVGGLIKAGTFLFNKPLTNACNDFINYVITEAFSVYGKEKTVFDFSKLEVNDERIS